MGQPQQTEQSNILNQNIYITQKNKSSMLTLLACLRKRIYVAQVLTKHTSRLGLNGLNQWPKQYACSSQRKKMEVHGKFPMQTFFSDVSLSSNS